MVGHIYGILVAWSSNRAVLALLTISSLSLSLSGCSRQSRLAWPNERTNDRW